MTAPRQVLPGTSYLVTRRCSQREFLLTPSPVANGIFFYVLAVAAARFGVLVHAYCVLSNHCHLVVTDLEARLPAFEQYLDSLVARAMNASLGRSEAFWGDCTFSAVALLSPTDVVDKAAYVLANPVAAGLVRHGRDWPGLWSAPDLIGAGAIEVVRPDFFFRATGPMPAVASLELSVPAGFVSADEFREQLTQALAAREHEASVSLRSENRTFLGAQRVLAQSPRTRPTTRPARRKLSPRIAGRDKWKRIEALGRLVEFRNAYRQALRAFRRGLKDVIFPAGTYWLRVAYDVPCAAA
jgi:REP element-mobilizing transposase RayT